MTPAFSQALAGLQPIQRGQGWIARCPAHEDNAPSLRIDAVDGKTLVKCHAGCDTPDVLSAIGLQMTDLFEPEPEVAAPLSRREVAHYDYTAEDGTVRTKWSASIRRAFASGVRCRMAGGRGNSTRQ